MSFVLPVHIFELFSLKRFWPGDVLQNAGFSLKPAKLYDHFGFPSANRHAEAGQQGLVRHSVGGMLLVVQSCIDASELIVHHPCRFR